jgi:hypothetical protein
MKLQAIEKEAKEGRTYSTLVFCLPNIFEEREVNCLSSLLPLYPEISCCTRQTTGPENGWMALGRKQFCWEESDG